MDWLIRLLVIVGVVAAVYVKWIRVPEPEPGSDEARIRDLEREVHWLRSSLDDLEGQVSELLRRNRPGPDAAPPPDQ